MKQASDHVSQTWLNLDYGSNYKEQTFGNRPQIRMLDNLVFLHGVVLKKAGTVAANDQLVATIPEGYRPPVVAYHTAQGSGNTVVNVQCDSAGNLTIKSGSSGNYVALDGMWWSVD